MHPHHQRLPSPASPSTHALPRRHPSTESQLDPPPLRSTQLTSPLPSLTLADHGPHPAASPSPNRSTIEMPEYLHFVRHLDSLLRDRANGRHRHNEIHRALHGGAATALRRLVPLPARRKAGAFFTPTTILKVTTQFLIDRLTPSSVVYDPACGAGDLLLAAARALPLQSTTEIALRHRLIGRDLCPQFIAAARRRLLLEAFHHESLNTPSDFAKIRTGCGLSAIRPFRHATHVIVNPPFGPHPAHSDAPWASGRVSHAATFLWRLLQKLRPGIEVIAILPDVLRSGTNYAAWRRTIAQRADLRSVRFFGQFDHATNVHATLLRFVTKPFDDASPFLDWIDRPRAVRSRVGDHFDVHVGSIVHFRDPHRGVRHPYIHSRNLLPWSTIRSVHDSRLSVRPPLRPPLVVVRRMSRPGDRHRAVAAIVALDRPVLLDNHLLTLTPRHGGIWACQRLLKELQQPTTTEALDRRIRCRHLTVGALSDLDSLWQKSGFRDRQNGPDVLNSHVWRWARRVTTGLSNRCGWRRASCREARGIRSTNG